MTKRPTSTKVPKGTPVQKPKAGDKPNALQQPLQPSDELAAVVSPPESSSVIRRKLRSLAQRLKFSKKSILVTLPGGGKVPDELKDEAVFVTLVRIGAGWRLNTAHTSPAQWSRAKGR